MMRYLKWNDDVVGTIGEDFSVAFSVPEYNEVVALYTRGSAAWTSEQFIAFLSERIISRDRRDIERILFRCGLSRYDVIRIAEITRGIHPKDMLWLAAREEEPLRDAMTSVFENIFQRNIDSAGDSIDTPEGYNIKRYGVFHGRYGIYKKRLNPLATDAESEVAVYLLANELGVSCCPAFRVDEDTVFSEFRYDFSREYLVHFRRLVNDARSDNEYKNLLSVRPQYKDAIDRMILLDFITRQDDRHLSNIAIKISGDEESFYPLYDNGRSLFYEDTSETVAKAIRNPEAYATTFGYAGTYLDYVKEICAKRGTVSDLINLTVPRERIAEILREAGFTDYRFDGALEWIAKTLEFLLRP
ncbi:MAG: hypothetical protein LBT52_05950 [Clostridiales Family XIII bacterium]|jgi:hypothetical protein|nr:hypothetical protein [Clostridiales Family XIII bacterium]